MKKEIIKTSAWDVNKVSNNCYILVKMELIGYVVYGALTLKNKSKTAKVVTGEIFILERGLYYVESDNWTDLKIVTIEVPLAIFRKGFYRINIDIMPQQQDGVVIQAANEEVREYFKRGDVLDVERLTELRFSKLLKMFFDQPSPFSSKLLWFKKLHEAIATAMDYIDEDISRSFNLVEIAENSGVSPSKLNRLFNNCFEASPYTWSLLHKMDYARYYVNTSNKKISEIANSIGYTDVAYFIRKYNIEYGATPLKERRLKKSKDA